MPLISDCSGCARPKIRRGLLLIAFATVVAGAAGDGAQAQCPLKASPRPGDTGDRKRTYGCEGLYIQIQAASVNVQVISLVRNRLRLPKGDSAYVHVPTSLNGLRDTVTVGGRGRQANLNWALDWHAMPGQPMIWLLQPVIKKIGLDSSRIGVYGVTQKRSGLGAPVYVPVDVRHPGDAFQGTAAEGRPRVVELVIRIPAAGAIEHRLGNGAWSREKPYNGDGYYSLLLEPESAGVANLDVRWRPNNSLQFGPAESLSIFFW
jgi:hypothetical protein